MKKTYAFIVSGAMLLGAGLSSCSSDTTTGVETGTTASEGTDGMNSGGGTTPAGENVSPLDTANTNAGMNNGGTMNGDNSGNNANSGNNGNNANSGTNDDSNAPKTTTPTTDNGN
jgi:hypothetical protein